MFFCTGTGIDITTLACEKPNILGISTYTGKCGTVTSTLGSLGDQYEVTHCECSSHLCNGASSAMPITMVTVAAMMLINFF